MVGGEGREWNLCDDGIDLQSYTCNKMSQSYSHTILMSQVWILMLHWSSIPYLLGVGE